MIIDGTNITSYRVISERGNIASLLAYPSIKTPDSQEWAEYDGVEVDLDEPKLNGRDVDLKLTADSVEDMESFIAILSATGYRELYIPLIDRTYKLRYTSQGNTDLYANGASFSVKMSDDFPLRNDGDKLGHGLPVPPLSRYYIDNINLSEYGLLVLNAKPSLYKSPSLRDSLKVTNSVMDGVIYDVGLANFKPKEVTFHVAFYCDSVARLMSNYDAFFSDLVAPGERTLGSSYIIEQPKFYYKSSSNFDLNINANQAILEFDLTFVFTNARPSLLDILLATEAWEFVISEDGYYINLKPY